MKEIISDASNFEQINIEEGRELNFFKKSEKKVFELVRRLANADKISEN